MAKSPGEKADALMKKASEAFARGKTQKAYDLYGDALQRYVEASLSEAIYLPRHVLAHYTRALLSLKGQAEGDSSADIVAGLRLVKDHGDPQIRRFEGLFFYLDGCKARLDDDFSTAEIQLKKARSVFATHGQALDKFELEREAAQLAADRGDWPAALSRSKQAVLVVEGNPRALIDAKVALAELLERHGDFESALKVLDSAETSAFDFNLSSLRYEMQDRIKIFRSNHPGIDLSDA
ncbi:MAG: hypothetical protein V3W41_04895 [Planctomycetota bacterium]